MRVLITGSYGYLGSLLTKLLISKEIPVTGIDLSQQPAAAEGNYLKYYSCDVTDKDRLSMIFREEKPTHVIHLASTFNKVHDPEREYAVDIAGSENILEISNHTASVRQLIYTSSAVAYGGHSTNPEWIPETFPLQPGKYRYGRNKSSVEELFSTMMVRKDMHVVILRICQVTGPSRNRDSELLNLLLKSPVLPRICMNNKIQLLHETDFLSLMTRILHDDEIEGVYNMASDNYAGIIDLAPNKLYVPLPFSFLSVVLWILWHTRLMNLEPASLTNGIYPIVIDPTKLMKRYDFKFRYTTVDAFSDTLMNDKRFSEALRQMRREIATGNFFKKQDMR
jgi:nucleoside-diphosphate-sugar epimerase